MNFDFPVAERRASRMLEATLAFAVPGKPAANADNSAALSAADGSVSAAAPTASAPVTAAAVPLAADGQQPLATPIPIPTPPLASNDIIDTFWDIPAIDIPSPEAIAKREKIQARRQQSGALTAALWRVCRCSR